jgi:Trypsin-like peptidase domain
LDYVLSPPVRERSGGCLVRLADDARKCVVFFGTPDPKIDDDLTVWGTGFLVKTTHDPAIYLVTAAHVIINKQDCPFVIRFNDKNGASRNHHIDVAEWHFHPTDRTVDVAVLEIELPEWADCLAFPQYSVMSEFKFESKDIGPGDVVYTVGLWKPLQGRKRNKPFVHVGHIGMVPQDDKISVKGWLSSEPVDVEAYLTEGEPLLGASGSPVFARRSICLGKGFFRGDLDALTWVYGSVWLLGLQSDAYFDRAIIDGSEKYVPRGTNIVVPSMKINEVLDKDELKDKRRF